MAVIIHEHGLQAAAIHMGNDLQNPNWTHPSSPQLRKILCNGQPREVLIKRLIDCIGIIKIRRVTDHHQQRQQLPVSAADLFHGSDSD